MSDTVLLICTRATGAPSVPTATKRKCVKCGAPVWASPASVIHITAQSGSNWKPICMECAAVELPRMSEPPTFLPTSEGQRAELSASLGPDAARVGDVGTKELYEWYRKAKKL